MTFKQINTSYFGKFFGKYSYIEYDENQLYLYIENKLHKSFKWDEVIGYTMSRPRIFGSTLEFIFETRYLKINFLKKSDCMDNIIVINRIITPI